VDRLRLLQGLVKENDTKLILLVLDGLGGLPLSPGGPTELEAAHTPNLDRLAKEGVCGLMEPVLPGITPGSGPAHLALFGYDPLEFELGRGVLEALGIDFPLQPGDVACRLNFATLDAEGRIVDRRAGRIPTEESAKLCAELDGIELPGVEVFVRPVKEHRAVLVLRGPGLCGGHNDTDPQATGVPPLPVTAKTQEQEYTAELLNRFIAEANRILAGRQPANGLLMRGISSFQRFPGFSEVYKLRAAAIATYPMYRGVAKVVGMDVLPCGTEVADELAVLREHYKTYDYLFVHVKRTDSSGEDGNFEAKVKAIEAVDELLPQVVELQAECLVVTGDHSTPAKLKSHSWHPVPLVLASPHCRPDEVERFTEKDCQRGGLGRLATVELMGLMLAHSLRLGKFGA